VPLKKWKEDYLGSRRIRKNNYMPIRGSAEVCELVKCNLVCVVEKLRVTGSANVWASLQPAAGASNREAEGSVCCSNGRIEFLD